MADVTAGVCLICGWSDAVQLEHEHRDIAVAALPHQGRPAAAMSQNAEILRLTNSAMLKITNGWLKVFPVPVH